MPRQGVRIMTSKKQYLQISEMAELLGITRVTLYKWEKRFSDFPARHKIASTVLYKTSDVEAWIDSKAVNVERVAK